MNSQKLSEPLHNLIMKSEPALADLHRIPDATMLDALNYIKAARALSVPAGLEVSRSGTGAHTWIFFTGPVPAETARRLGTGCCVRPWRCAAR